MERTNLTEGSVLRTLLSFSLPYLLAYFLQTLYGLADLFIIGRFCGTESITAVSIGSQVMHMITVILVGIAMGATVTIAHAIGAGDRRRAAGVVGNTITIFLIIAVAAAAVLLALVKPVVALVSTPPEAVEGTVRYLTICFAGIPFITAYNVISAVFRGMGDSRRPMYFVAVACVVNVALDCLFIGALGMGPAGAALGTVIAQAFSVLIAVVVIVRTPMGLPLRRSDLRLRGSSCSRILRIGLPIALQDGFIQVAFLAITVFANIRGLNDAAAVGIVERIIGLLFLVPSSLLASISAVAAQNIGAGKRERAQRTLRYALLICIGYGAVAAVLMQFVAPGAVGLFDGSPEVVRLGAQYLRSYSWDCIFAGIHFCFSGYFCAAGRSGLSFLHNALSIVLIRIPGSWYGAFHYPDTLFPMGLAAPLGSVFSVILCIFFYRWLRNKGMPVLKNTE